MVVVVVAVVSIVIVVSIFFDMLIIWKTMGFHISYNVIVVIVKRYCRCNK